MNRRYLADVVDGVLAEEGEEAVSDDDRESLQELKRHLESDPWESKVGEERRNDRETSSSMGG
jgi:hypothetical protein